MTATSPPGVEIDGDKVRELRKLAGLSQRDLAELARCSASYLCNIENGHRETVSPSTFIRICDALHLSKKNRKDLERSSNLASAA